MRSPVSVQSTSSPKNQRIALTAEQTKREPVVAPKPGREPVVAPRHARFRVYLQATSLYSAPDRSVGA
ncbi:hypothetical protein CBOM_08053 [Ceraceosorus bombacis]|uniref:Uncharacterized protein n=1 Tax=Ceraceosorus bombacis TaxID=401625 RepID=A0A0P1BK76_9BASI|nr:hypothetical protein CBOM_08053 [Ceraceosorus bombacis]